MKIMHFAVAGAAAATLLGSASADFTGATILNLGEIDSGNTTYQVELSFDAPDDQLLAVGALPSVGGLSFSATSALVNESGAFNGLRQEDAPNGLNAAWDSWLSISGSDFIGNDTAFSPGFAGGDGIASAVNGMSFSETDGGYFDGNPTTISGGVGGIVIAQFTIANGADFTYGAVVSWIDDDTPNGETVDSLFEVTTVVVPAPGAFALLGLAGLASRRRRG